MKEILSSGLALWGLSMGLAYGQSTDRLQPVLSNIRVETSAQQVVVRYDVANLLPKDSVFVQVEGRTRGLLKVKTLSGDAGIGVTSGLNKIIVWDYPRDGETLDGEIQAKVNIKPYVQLPNVPAGKKPESPKKPDTKQAIGGGPANALLSAILPGLGNVMVQPNHRIRFQPVIALAYIGALAYGFSQKSKSDEQYSLYLQQPYDRLAIPYYNEANSLHHKYIMAAGAAAVIWIADVTYTLLKGMKNEKLRKSRPTSVRPTMNYVGQTPTFGLRYQL